MNILKLALRLAFIPLVSAPVHQSIAQVISAPVGIMRISIPKQADTYFSVGFHRSLEFETTVESISDSTVTVSGIDNWTPNQFVYSSGSQPNTYFVLIGSGDLEGAVYTITANGSNNLTLELPQGEDLSQLKSNAQNSGAGDSIQIYPYWTVQELFSDVAVGNVDIILFNNGSQGINHLSQESEPFSTIEYIATQWQSGGLNRDDTTIAPGDAVLVRNKTAEDLEVVHMGAVPVTHFRTSIVTASSTEAHDVHIGLRSLVPMNIGDMAGLGQDGDELLIFNSTNASNQINYRTADRILEYSATPAPGGWYDGITKVDTTFALEPGKGYVLRKAPRASNDTIVWQGAPPYVPASE